MTVAASRSENNPGQHGMPVLWLYGASGLGKTTVAWELYRRGLSEAGIALIELDQISICFPETESDPGNLRLLTDNFVAVWSNLRARGVQGLIVTGSIAARRARDVITARLPEGSITTCRLHVSPEEHARRYRSRAWLAGLLEQALSDAAEVDASDRTDTSINVTGLTASDAARTILTQTGWSPLSQAQPEVPRRPQKLYAASSGTSSKSQHPLPLLWLCGPRGVGKSATGYRIAAALWRSGIRTAFIDIEQLGHVDRRNQAQQAQLRAGNFAGLCESFRSGSVDCVIVAGSSDDYDVLDTYANAAPAIVWHVCRLEARLDHLRERLLTRARSLTGPSIPNILRALSDDEIFEVARRAVQQSKAMERDGIGDFCIDTSDRTIDEVAEQAGAALQL